ncbi:SGNH/GDSL hydrolase family protein [Solidesulfovibrio sp.]
MKTGKAITLLLCGCLVTLSAITWYYKQGWDRMDKQMREIATDVNTVNTVMKDLSGLYSRTRGGIILSQLRSQDAALLVMFGDSIVEQMFCPSLDGMDFLNAGISGSKVLEAKPFLDNILAASRGPLVALSMGTNDAFGATLATPEQFRAGYAELARAVLAAGRTPVLVTLPPLEQSRDESRLFDKASLDAYNGIIRDIGARHGLIVADVNAVLAGKYGSGKAGSFTVDGVHLDAAAAALWRDTVYAAIRQALARPGN